MYPLPGHQRQVSIQILGSGTLLDRNRPQQWICICTRTEDSSGLVTTTAGCGLDPVLPSPLSLSLSALLGSAYRGWSLASAALRYRYAIGLICCSFVLRFYSINQGFRAEAGFAFREGWPLELTLPIPLANNRDGIWFEWGFPVPSVSSSRSELLLWAVLREVFHRVKSGYCIRLSFFLARSKYYNPSFKLH